MKKQILIIILCVANSTLFAQGHFKAQNGAIIWQNVYNMPTTGNIRNLYTQIANVAKSDNVLTGNITEGRVNYAASDAKRLQMPLYMLRPFTANVIIEQKPGRYRVTVSNIVFKDLNDGNRLTTEETTPIGDYVLKRSGDFRTSQLKALEIFSADLEQRFKISDNLTKW